MPSQADGSPHRGNAQIGLGEKVAPGSGLAVTGVQARMRNLTGADDVQGDPSGPDCFFRSSWSSDGQWLAFSSGRNTDWRGHDDGRGWEHTQELSIYVIRVRGQDRVQPCARRRGGRNDLKSRRPR